MRTSDVTITLAPNDRYELSDSTAKEAHTVRLLTSSLEGLVVWHRDLSVPSDREIVCGCLRYPLTIANISTSTKTITLRYQLEKWTRMQLSELTLHDGIYYEDGFITDFIY